MSTRVLFLITSDPRQSARAAEGVRIAAGVGAWKKAEVRLYFHGAAVLALGECVDDLVDEDNFTRYLPIVAEWGEAVYVERNAAHWAEVGEPTLKCQPIGTDELARLAAGFDCVLRF